MSPFIETINKLDKRWCLLLLFALVALFIAGIIFFSKFQEQQKAISLEKSVSTLKMDGIKAQYNGELDKANDLFTKALSQALDSDSPMKVIELFSRLVQVKIRNHHLKQTEPLVEGAIQIALAIKGTNASDSNLDVWMDDMANAFYKCGEHCTDDRVKEFCMKHYLDIKLQTEDRCDNYLSERAEGFINFLMNRGRFLEAVPYQEQACNYYRRTSPNDPLVVSVVHRHLINVFLQRHQFDQAKSEIKQSVEACTLPGINREIEFNWRMGGLEEAKGDLQAAEILYQKALKLDTDKMTLEKGIRYNLLGYVEQRLGQWSEAEKFYRRSLAFFDLLPKYDLSSYFHTEISYYSGQVFAAEHLAQIELKLGNLSLASSLQTQAKKTRSQYPYWAEVKDPDSVYVLTGSFPFQLIDSIRTHLSLEDINQN